MSTTTLLVRQDQLATTHLHSTESPALADGQVRVRVAHFALTANNITYAAFGQAMAYWQFFPVPADAPPADGSRADGSRADGSRAGEGAAWGVIPVWGFATVVQSLHPGVAVGERLYGYWPMASHAVLQPARLTAEGFSDGAAHRATLHAVYNRYLRCNTDPFYRADTEPLQALLRPLFLTAWLIDDFLADNGFFGATTAAPGVRPLMLLSSASSKTAIATAAQLARRPEVAVVGLTSAANVGFCQSLGCYDQVLSYEQLDTLDADAPAVYVDFAGNGALRLAIHSRFSRLAYSCAIGGTHVEQLAGARDLPGPRATLFFAPAQVKKRSGDWGAAAFNQKLVDAWHAYAAQVTGAQPPWLVVAAQHGPAAVQAGYAQVLGGRMDPRLGLMLSLNPA